MGEARSERDERPASAPGAAARAAGPPGLAARQMLALQRTAGNRAVVQEIQRTLYRGMAADKPNGDRPLLGNEFSKQLGVRPGDVEGKTNPGPGDGGASTSNKRATVYPTTASKSYTTTTANHNQTNQSHREFRWIWQIEEASLPPELRTHNNHGDHVNIEAAKPMPLAELQQKVQGTQASWTRSDPP